MAVKYTKLFRILLEENMTNAQLAEKAGISPNTLQRLRDNKNVSLGTIEKICRVLDCKISDILEFSEDGK